MRQFDYNTDSKMALVFIKRNIHKWIADKSYNCDVRLNVFYLLHIQTMIMTAYCLRKATLSMTFFALVTVSCDKRGSILHS